jgi:glucokinase
MDVIGVDIGATKVNALRIDAGGAIRGRQWQAHDAAAGDDPFTCASRLVAEAIAMASAEGGRVGAIGVSVAGLVDSRAGVLVDGGLLLVKNLPLRKRLEEEFGVPVVVENDANATLIAALHDHQPSGPEATSLLFALGTGIGGAVAIGTNVLHGSLGFGGELGHVPVMPPSDVRCVCGSSGCLELIASGSAVGREARAAAHAGRAAGLVELSGTDADALTAVDVVRAANAGEPWSIATLDRAGEAIGTAVAALGPALDPETVFISGSFGHAAGSMIIPAIERRLTRQHVYPNARPLPVIRVDSVGPDAAAFGAGLLAREPRTE